MITLEGKGKDLTGSVADNIDRFVQVWTVSICRLMRMVVNIRKEHSMSNRQFGQFNMERTCRQVRNVSRFTGILVCLFSAIPLAACAGVQSSLAPAGDAAEQSQIYSGG